eukprot:1159440-Pelagomonas_calceolata.AAC.4
MRTLASSKKDTLSGRDVLGCRHLLQTDTRKKFAGQFGRCPMEVPVGSPPPQQDDSFWAAIICEVARLQALGNNENSAGQLCMDGE